MANCAPGIKEKKRLNSSWRKVCLLLLWTFKHFQTFFLFTFKRNCLFNLNIAVISSLSPLSRSTKLLSPSALWFLSRHQKYLYFLSCFSISLRSRPWRSTKPLWPLELWWGLSSSAGFPSFFGTWSSFTWGRWWSWCLIWWLSW